MHARSYQSTFQCGLFTFEPKDMMDRWNPHSKRINRITLQKYAVGFRNGGRLDFGLFRAMAIQFF